MSLWRLNMLTRNIFQRVRDSCSSSVFFSFFSSCTFKISPLKMHKSASGGKEEELKMNSCVATFFKNHFHDILRGDGHFFRLIVWLSDWPLDILYTEKPHYDKHMEFVEDLLRSFSVFTIGITENSRCKRHIEKPCCKRHIEKLRYKFHTKHLNLV